MEYAQLGGSDPNAHHDQGNKLAQVDAEDRYEKEQQSLRARLERRRQQQQQQRQQRQHQDQQQYQQHQQLPQQLPQQHIPHTDEHFQVHWDQYQTPVSAYPQTSDPPAPYSPEHGYYIPNSTVNAGYTDVQAQMHTAFYGNSLEFDTAIDTTNPATLQPRGYDLEDWQLVPNSISIEDQLGLPPTTTGAEEFYPHLDSGFLGTEQGQTYNNFSDELVQNFMAPPDQQFEFLEPPPSRGVELFDSPVPDFGSSQQEPVDLWSPQQRLRHTPETISEWFSKNYASKQNPPLSGNIMSEQGGGIWCRICRPYTFWDSSMYRQHKEETHGIDFKTGFQYWAPMEVRPISGVVGFGYEGYCATCRLWIPLDVSKSDFNWFQHASRCQDHTVPAYQPKPAKPIDRWTSSSSEDEGCDIADLEREARRLQGSFLRPKPPFASNSNSNPSDEGSSEICSSASSRSVLTSNSNSNSSVNSAMSQHSLESRRKKVLRLRKRKGARSSNQGVRAYQCTFCMADFANFGDWRRHEEVIHLVLDKWVCAPEGQYKSGTRECVYCDEVHEERSNIPNRCNASYCHGKGPAERVFARKDHLKQHLKRMHGIHTWRPSFEAWSKKAKGPRQSRCGFCSATFEDWHQRMQHVAWEFKHGQKMAMWQGDWGLESTWMMGNKLGNAIIPKTRSDHTSKTHQGENKPPVSQVHTPNTSSAHVKSAPPQPPPPPPSHDPPEEKGKRVQRKPRLTSLRDGFSQQQQQEQQQQEQALTPPLSWSVTSVPQTTPPSRQSPLAPYSTNQPVTIQPRPPEMAAAPSTSSNAPSKRTGSRSGQSFQCPYCSTKYTRQDNLRRHLKTHLVK